MPGRGGWSCLCFAIAHDTGYNRIRIIHCRAKGGSQSIAKLAPLVNRARNGRCQVTWKSAGPGETLHQVSEPRLIQAKFWIEVCERAFEIKICQIRGRAMSGTGHQKHTQI